MAEDKSVTNTSTEPGATKKERIDFLKQMITFTEENIRSYDLKAQICLAAFGLAGYPLVAIIQSTCATAASHSVLAIGLIVYVVAITIYLWVLWPVASQQSLTKGLSTRNLFYLLDPLVLGGAAFADQLKSLSVELELTAEAIKLAYIRTVKASRFKRALIVTFAAYLAVLVSFFVVGRCG